MPIQSVRLATSDVLRLYSLKKSGHYKTASNTMERVLTLHLPHLDRLPPAKPYQRRAKVSSFSLPSALLSLLKETSMANGITLTESIRRCLASAASS